jgi:valyl-tRNA synthetase
MFSLYLTGKVPFKLLYIHGCITDEKGQKMSKSKGNVINPMDYVNKYGADALRMGLIVGGNTSAKETALSEDKVRGYRNFANKIWNMARFMEMIKAELPTSPEALKAIDNRKLHPKDQEILQNTENLIKMVNQNLAKNRLSDAGNLVYQFMWHVLADEYIEHVKAREDGKSKAEGVTVFDYSYKTCLKLLHPFMPFVTERIWQEINKDEDSTIPLMISQWPK